MAVINNTRVLPVVASPAGAMADGTEAIMADGQQGADGLCPAEEDIAAGVVGGLHGLETYIPPRSPDAFKDRAQEIISALDRILSIPDEARGRVVSHMVRLWGSEGVKTMERRINWACWMLAIYSENPATDRWKILLDSAGMAVGLAKKPISGKSAPAAAKLAPPPPVSIPERYQFIVDTLCRFFDEFAGYYAKNRQIVAGAFHKDLYGNKALQRVVNEFLPRLMSGGFDLSLNGLDAGEVRLSVLKAESLFTAEEIGSIEGMINAVRLDLIGRMDFGTLRKLDTDDNGISRKIFFILRDAPEELQQQIRNDLPMMLARGLVRFLISGIKMASRSKNIDPSSP